MQLTELGFPLHALGDHGEIQGVEQIDGPGQDGEITRIPFNVSEQRAVQLHEVDGKLPERVE